MNFRARMWAGCLLTVAIVAVAVAGNAQNVVNAQSNTQRKDPLPTFAFKVEIDGESIGFFKSVTGLKFETEVVEFQEGGVNDSTHKLAGRTKFANIRLSRGFTGDRYLFDWARTIRKPNPARVTVRITMLDNRLARIASWKFVNAFPVKWEGPDLDASKNELAIETIEIAHEGLFMNDDDNQPQ